jgi:hypothetical protein
LREIPVDQERAMPPAKRASSSSPSKSASASPKRSTAKTAASTKTGSTRATRAKSAASKSTRSSASAAKATRAKASAPKTSARSTQAKRPTSRNGATAADPLEQVSERIRRLNERIIEAGRDAGEQTLSSYEKALKAIASGIERGPGSSDIEWISNLASAQAKFIRDVTKSITSAGRDLLK